MINEHEPLVALSPLAASVAEEDLSLARLSEGHTDALAILAELGAGPRAAGGSTASSATARARGRARTRW